MAEFRKRLRWSHSSRCHSNHVQSAQRRRSFVLPSFSVDRCYCGCEFVSVRNADHLDPRVAGQLPVSSISVSYAAGLQNTFLVIQAGGPMALMRKPSLDYWRTRGPRPICAARWALTISCGIRGA
jgi:hypothetical protein